MSDALKKLAGRYAADLVQDGMRVGLGTGSTANHAVRRLGERVREGLQIRGLPTSRATEQLAIECGIDVISFDDVTRLDLTIDGADEVDRQHALIKGGGGALLREKVVASCSSALVIVVDDTKLVPTLGIGFALPVEVVPFAWRPVAAQLREIGGEPVLRHGQDGNVFVSDNHNWILDWRPDGGIEQPDQLEAQLAMIPGLVESGLFVGLTSKVIIGRADGPEVRDTPD